MESDNALLNSCVLQHLFELVDIETLKICRYVCKTWNFVAGIQLRKTTWVCLELVEEHQDFADTFNTPSDPSMRMMRNFQLRINDFTVILGVLLQHRSSILSLDLYNFDSYLADTLLSLPSLEHLTIRSMSSSPEIPDWNRTPFGGVPFPTLKSCSLVCGFSNEGRQRSPVSTSILMDFYIDLLRSSEKTLERLQLSRFDYSDLREIFHKINLQGISDLVLQEVSSISRNSADMTAKELKLFKKLVRVKCCNITRLKCWVPKNTNEEHIRDFFSIILESCQKNLKTLHLSWNPSANYDYLFIEVNFPVLTELVIDCFESPEDSQPVLQKLKTFLVKCRTLRRFQCWMPKDDTGQNVADILESLPNAEEVDLLAKFGKSKVSQGFATLPKIRRLTLEQNFGLPLGELASRLPNIQELSIVLAETGSRGWARMEKLKVLNIKSGNDTKFDFHRHYNITDINFPNLTELSITLSAGSGAIVFGTLRNLKCLYLEEGSSLCDEDITGIESERLLTLKDDPEDVVRNRPYIGDLKCLQVLRLEGPATTDASLKYGISNVNSLTHLTIQIPAVRVTKIVREESIGIRKYFQNSRGFGSSVREVRLHRLKNDITALNIESLMPPKLPRLVELIFLITKYQPIDPLQVDAMIASRRRRHYFRFSQTSLNSSPINGYKKKFVFEKIKAA